MCALCKAAQNMRAIFPVYEEASEVQENWLAGYVTALVDLGLLAADEQTTLNAIFHVLMRAYPERVFQNRASLN